MPYGRGQAGRPLKPRGTSATQLGSVSFATNANGSSTSRQDFDAWGAVRSGGVSATSLNYTGQRLDSTGLLDYHARLYDPLLARFVSADTIVPSSASGGLDGVQRKPLTADFHEPGFVATLNRENTLGFWFQLSDDDRQQAGLPWGPANPQSLNRYSYVLNAPVRWTDPSGHCVWDLCIIEGAAVGAVIVEVVIPAVVGAVVIAGAYEAGGALGRAHAAPAISIPQKAKDILDYVQKHNGTPPKDYKGGREYKNENGKLPAGKYKEYDVDPKLPNVDRNDERVVINQDTGEAWYTPDHYRNFEPIP